MTDHGEPRKDPYLRQAKRLSCLEFPPQDPEGWAELARTLKRHSKSVEHAARIISRYCMPGAPTRCPTPGDIAAMAKSVPADPAHDNPELQASCAECEAYAGAWRWNAERGGVERCQCPRGQKLRGMDRARQNALVGPANAKREGMSDPIDWAKRAAGDLG